MCLWSVCLVCVRMCVWVTTDFLHSKMCCISCVDASGNEVQNSLLCFEVGCSLGKQILSTIFLSKFDRTSGENKSEKKKMLLKNWVRSWVLGGVLCDEWYVISLVVVWIITSDILRTLCLNIQMFINLEFNWLFLVWVYHSFLWHKLGFCYVNIHRLTRVLIGVYEMFSDEFFTGISRESMKLTII